MRWNVLRFLFFLIAVHELDAFTLSFGSHDEGEELQSSGSCCSTGSAVTLGYGSAGSYAPCAIAFQLSALPVPVAITNVYGEFRRAYAGSPATSNLANVTLRTSSLLNFPVMNGDFFLSNLALLTDRMYWLIETPPPDNYVTPDFSSLVRAWRAQPGFTSGNGVFALVVFHPEWPAHTSSHRHAFSKDHLYLEMEYDEVPCPPGAVSSAWPSCECIETGWYGAVSFDLAAEAWSSCQECNCDPAGSVTSACSLGVCSCTTGYSGDKCDTCAPEFHPADGLCVACGCNTARTVGGSNLCDDGGQCTCTSGGGLKCSTCAVTEYEDSGCTPCDVVDNCASPSTCTTATNSQCTNCMGGTWPNNDAERTQCEACNCDVAGSVDADCVAGTCTCLEHFSGDKCDECEVGYFRSTDTACSECACNQLGTVGGSIQCDASGQCPCSAGYMGKKCDTCTSGYFTVPGGVCAGCAVTSCLGPATLVPCDGTTSTDVSGCTCDLGSYTINREECAYRPCPTGAVATSPDCQCGAPGYIPSAAEWDAASGVWTHTCQEMPPSPPPPPDEDPSAVVVLGEEEGSGGGTATIAIVMVVAFMVVVCAAVIVIAVVAKKGKTKSVARKYDDEEGSTVKLSSESTISAKVKAMLDHPTSEVIGSGGSGIVYKCKAEDGTWIAVKTLKAPSQQEIAQFHEEVTTLTRLQSSHINIVAMKFFCVNPEHYLAMELVNDGTLFERIRDTSMDAAQKDSICKQIAAALRFVHSCQVAHLDCKSKNVLMAVDVPKLSDFGISVRIDEPAPSRTSVECTPQYASPEFLQGQVPHGPLLCKVDSYSFGQLALAVWTGTEPYAGIAVDLVVDMVTRGEAIDIPESVPQQWADVISQCRSPPSSRPTMATLCALLEDGEDGGATIILDHGAINASIVSNDTMSLGTK